MGTHNHQVPNQSVNELLQDNVTGPHGNGLALCHVLVQDETYLWI